MVMSSYHVTNLLCISRFRRASHLFVHACMFAFVRSVFHVTPLAASAPLQQPCRRDSVFYGWPVSGGSLGITKTCLRAAAGWAER